MYGTQKKVHMYAELREQPRELSHHVDSALTLVSVVKLTCRKIVSRTSSISLLIMSSSVCWDLSGIECHLKTAQA